MRGDATKVVAVAAGLWLGLLGQPSPAADDPLRFACLPPAVATGVRCTFDTFGVIRDSHGFPVFGAEVTDGERRAITNRSGFYDLFRPAPAEHRLTVKLSRSCTRTFRMTPDAAAAVAAGGVRRDVKMPCTRPTYNAFALGYVQHGRLNAIGRAGVWHSQERGWLETYELSRDGRLLQPEPFAVTAEDARNPAGGVTRSGALVVFYSRYDVQRRTWRAIDYLRMARDGTDSGSISTGRTIEYSPYGPLIILPSGGLIQTFYGVDRRVSRVYVSHSSDDGRTWGPLTPIDSKPPFQISEAAAAVVAGTTDRSAQILLVARANGRVAGRRWRGLVQYVSPDGGRTWRRLGRVVNTNGEAIPWVVSLDSARAALVYADRGTMTLRRSITVWRDAMAGRWWAPVTLYHSKAAESRYWTVGDFGYPSIASYGPGEARKAIVFNDVDPVGSTDFIDVDLMVLPLWATPGTRPARLSS